MLRRSLTTSSLLVVLMLVMACGSPRVTTNGFLFTGIDLSFLEDEDVTCRDVYRALGTPTARRNFTGEPFGGEVWFYIGQRVSYYAFLAPEVVEQRVLAVQFDGEIDAVSPDCGDDPAVTEVRTVDGNEFRHMMFNPNATAVIGNTRTLLQELFGDIGRFSRPGVQQ